ncbi:HAD-IIB family hydrolase [Catalinimonas niigatensis]|uniref:HAD-IIB family hydrolase n=1 Tax=Catalinimonas niigatensis TaxID=1397264 RepID=UPI00266500CB|nr:HAD hydrolase family protein [Catalinimonas niigatensis]WPP51273.1 HAD hydrolase family protein [Catalinimonas niigatensis]
MKWIIYTDLDGTLLDFKTYSYKETQGTVEQLRQMDIPVVFCSSKTRLEQEVYRKAMDLQFPFIVENGSAILIPDGFFDFELSQLDLPQSLTFSQIENYTVIVLGKSFHEIREVIEGARKKVNIEPKGYKDLTLEEIIQLTSLPSDAAQRAASREYSETLLEAETESKSWDQFLEMLNQQHLQCISGGKFHTVMGKGSDKGKAVQILNKLFRKEYGEIKTVGLGDSANDLPLLNAVGIPFLVQKPSGQWEAIDHPSIQKIEAIGPQGWNLAVRSLFNF